MENDELVRELGRKIGAFLVEGLALPAEVLKQPPKLLFQEIVIGIRQRWPLGENDEADQLVRLISESIRDHEAKENEVAGADDVDIYEDDDEPYEAPSTEDLILDANAFLETLSIEERRALFASIKFCPSCAVDLDDAELESCGCIHAKGTSP